jgi:hypothetical protein
MTQFIIHFGYHVSPMIYDHDINYLTWKHLLENISSQSLSFGNLHLTQTEHNKIYISNGLTYEFNMKQTTLFQCYTDTMKDINIINIKNALTYHRQRTVYEYDFQPLNTYHTHETTRNVFVSQLFTIIFENITSMDPNHKDTHEITIIYQGDGLLAMKDINLTRLIDYFNQYLK